MEIDQFIDELRSSGIHLDIHGDKLKVSSENDKIAENTIAKIKEHKDVLLNYLTKYQGAGVKSEVQIPRLETSDSYVLSSGQHRLWLLSQFDDGSIAYNYTDTYRIEGSLDRELLAQSFARLLARHEILRTTFGKNAEGEIRQFVHAPLAMQVPIEFRDARNNRRPRALASELAEKAAIEAFELTTGPLIRLLLVQTDQEEFFFTYVIHHIVSDGWSMVVLIRELFAHYMDLVEGKESSLAPLRIQYKDFASWQQQQLSGDQLKSQQQFWQQQFEGDLPILNLPTDHARPAIKTFNGRSAHSELDASLTQPFHALLKEEGCSLFMGVLALTKTLLYKYTGQSDIIVGSPTAGRNHSDLEEQLGFYVNTLALRTRFDEQSSFRELLGLVKKNALACFDHQSYPFDRLVEELALEKDRSRNPLFDVMVIVQNTNVNSAGEAEAFGDIQISYEEKEGNTSLVDLSLEYAESPNGLYLKIEYNTDLFKRETIQRMGQHLRLLLRAIVSQPDQAICQLTCISEQERELLLNGFNDTQTDYRKDLTILDLLAKQVERIPNNTAVAFEDRSLTFQQLDELSNQLAAYLQKYYHVERNDMVALKLDRSEWMLVSIVGVLKAGGAYVPIGTDYPQDRITYIREESEFKVCIDKAELGRFLRMRNDLPTVAIQHRVQPSDYAYAIYTSGSTGRPKGVLNDQAGLFNRLMWMRDDLDITDKDVLIQKTPYTFDVSVWELVMPLVTGSRLVFARPEGHKDPLYLQDLIRREQFPNGNIKSIGCFLNENVLVGDVQVIAHPHQSIEQAS
ncbi:MAG: condensation domain-containing protein, partial [Bacteroidota bacterium]